MTHEVAGVDANEHAASLGADTDLLDRLALSLPIDGDVDASESLLNKLLDGVGLASSQNEVVGLILLQHHVHALFER